jgi:hypothetical protein
MTSYPISQEQLDKVKNNFTYHAPFGNQPERYGELHKLGDHLARIMMNLCPPSRELSLALTKLEEAIMWSNSAIARNEQNEDLGDQKNV